MVSFLADGLPGCASFVPLLHMLILLVAASDLYILCHRVSTQVGLLSFDLVLYIHTPPILRASLRGVFVAVLSNYEYQVCELHSVPPLV